jgi:hypothetical protein
MENPGKLQNNDSTFDYLVNRKVHHWISASWCMTSELAIHRAATSRGSVIPGNQIQNSVTHSLWYVSDILQSRKKLTRDSRFIPRFRDSQDRSFLCRMHTWYMPKWMNDWALHFFIGNHGVPGNWRPKQLSPGFSVFSRVRCTPTRN